MDAPSKLNRRQWAKVLGCAAGAAPALLAQTPAPPANPAAVADNALAEVKQVSDKLAALTVPMNVEPAFRFEAY